MSELNVDELFILNLRELEEKAQSNDLYDLLAISAIIRKLLLDGDPLVHKVNRKYKIKLRFYVGLPPDNLSPTTMWWSIQDGFDPNTGYPGRPTGFVNVDGLLNAKVLMAHGHFFTLKDLSTRQILRGVFISTLLNRLLINLWKQLESL